MGPERAARVRAATEEYQRRMGARGQGGSAFFGKTPKPPEGRAARTHRPLWHISAKVRGFGGF